MGARLGQGRRQPSHCSAGNTDMSSRLTITWMQTWSAPAWRCWLTRSAIAPSSPQATSASMRRLLPGAVTSASPNP